MFSHHTLSHTLRQRQTFVCPDIESDYVQNIPEAGQSTLQGWCSSTAVSLACNANGEAAPTISDALSDSHCDVCSCSMGTGQAAIQPPAPASPTPVVAAAAPTNTPTCTGSMKLKPDVAPGTIPPTLQNWCLRPAVNTVCDPGVDVKGDDTENACQNACTCP